ncbi:MAG TPA: radical SAM family heme chaperone HemW [Acidimicrobiia bacterium]
MSISDLTVRPDSPQLADSAADAATAYVHVPFCARVCPYCDFAVVAGRDDLMDRYADAVVTEIGMAPPWRCLDALYVGGGTPSRFGSGRLARVVDAVRGRFGLADGAEVTLEANPEDWTPQLATALLAAGFTRVSFGAQSFSDAVLLSLGRRHLAPDVVAAVAVARREGFPSINVDLIFGTPGETIDSWRATVEAAVELDVDHVSCYALTVEKGTPLSRAVAQGAPAPDPDLQADQYELAAELLAAAGYVRYEVSNWARPGHPCLYNLVVWAQGEYEAFGNGAHGFRRGRRFRNVRRVDAYLQKVETGELPRAGEEVVSGWGAELDRLFVGLRRAAGVADGPGVEAFLGSEDGRRLLDLGIVEHIGGRLRVVRPLLTDAVERVVLSSTPETR